MSIFKEKINILLLINFALIFSFIIWGLNKGIDFTDESYYLIGYHFNIETDKNISFFHRIFLTFFGWGNFTIPEIRLLRLFLTLISVLFLSFSVSNYFNIKNKIELILFSINFSMLSYVFYPNSISYNTISSVLITVILGLFFLLKSNQHKVTIAFFIGFFFSILILNKFTNIVIFTVITVLFLFVERKRIKESKKLLFVILLSSLTGSSISFYLIFESLQNFQEGISNFHNGIILLESHKTITTLTSYYYGMVHIISKSKWLLLIILVLITFKKAIKVNFSFSIILSLLLFLVFANPNYITNPIGFFIPYFAFISGIIVLKIHDKKLIINKLNVFIVFFILTPFLSGLGTNNSPYIHFIFYGNILGLGLFFLIKNYDLFPRVIFTFFLISSISIQFFYGYINHPYRLNSKLSNQIIEVKNIPTLKGVLVDSATNLFIREVEELKTTNSQYVFTFADYFVVSLILNKEPYPFYWLNESNLHQLSSVVSNKVKPNDLMIIIPNNNTIKKETQTAFLKIGINFAENYSLKKTIIYNGNELLFYCFKEIKSEY